MNNGTDTTSKRNHSGELTRLVYGKVPPQAMDLEKSILGSIIQFRSAVDEAIEMLIPDCFYVESHKMIFQAISALFQKNYPIDAGTVVEELRKMDFIDLVGGPYYVNELTISVISPAHTVHHCRIILQKFIQREVIRISADLIGQAYEDSTDAFDLLSDAETLIYSIRQLSIKKQFKSLDHVFVEVIRELEDLRHRDHHLTGVTSGFKDLDFVTSGWQKSDLIILAARPSVGKTSFALTLGRHAAMTEPKTGVAFFSLETKDKKLIHRMLASESETWLWRLTNARLDDSQMKQLYTHGIQKLAGANFIVDDSSGLSLVEFKAKAKRLVNKHGIGLIIIDYLQLITAPSHIKNREQQISTISRELKNTAGELNVPIIALSQLSRDIEKTKGREPVLADLRESGAIEQDADLVIFLWPPGEDEIAKNSSLLNSVNAKIAKHRSGSLAKFVGDFQKEIQRWNYFKVIDNTYKPMGANWRPLSTINAQPNLFIEPNKPDPDDQGGDMPF